MKINQTLLVAAALSLTAAAATFAASSQMLGTWKLNESKSEFSAGATKNHTVTYAAEKGDMMKVTVDGVDKDGKAVHWTWKGKFDGQPHKTKGNSIADAAVYKQMDDHTNELTLMKDGKAMVTGTITVSKDGKSRVVTTTMTDSEGKKHTDKAYYDKE